MSADITHVSDADFEAEVTNSDRPVVIDFWAPWCGPCRQMEPAFEELAAANPSHKWVKVNVDDNPATAAASRSSRSRPSSSWRAARRRSASPAPSRRGASPPSSGRRARLIAQLVDVTYAPGSKPLLEGVTVVVHERTKLAIVGPTAAARPRCCDFFPAI